MKANCLCIVLAVALSHMGCGSGMEMTAVLSGAALRPQRFSTGLSGAAVRPNPVQSEGRGSVLIKLEGKKLIGSGGSYYDLSSNATAAHIHGPADENSTAGVFCTLQIAPTVSWTVDVGTGPGSCGDRVLTDADVANLESGRMYMDIHNATYPNGEIRGKVRLRTPPGTGTATVTVAGKKLKVSGNFTGLESPAVEAHIHGPADENSTAAVLCTLTLPSSPSGEIQAGQGFGSCGDLVLDDADVSNFENGRMYIDVHPRDFEEIRGQLHMNL